MSDSSPNSKPEVRLGKGMILAGWLIALALLTMYFNQWLNERQNPNANPMTSTEGGVNQVVLVRNFQHHYVASGSINGVEVTFMVDTGATTVSIPAHLSDKLGLRSGAPQMVNTANGVVETRATTIHELRLGTITLNNVRANINPGMHGDEILLGMSALKNIEFTHRDGTLTLKQY